MLAMSNYTRKDSGQSTASCANSRNEPMDAVLAKVLQEGDLSVTCDGRVYYTATEYGRRRTYSIGGEGLRRLLGRLYFLQTNRPLPEKVMKELEGHLAALAEAQGKHEEVWIRVGEAGEDIEIDLGTDDGSVVHVSKSGWEIRESATVKFWRPPGMQPMVIPEKSPDGLGSLILILSYVLRLSDSDGVLVAAFMLGCLFPRGPYPILELHGDPGSGKTTIAWMLKRLLDPFGEGLSGAPKDPRDLVLAARNGWILGLDNCSDCPSWLADALCRLSTGGSHRTRRLYSNDEESVVTVQRPAIITAVQNVLTRGDLQDRAIAIECQNIPARQRRTLAEVQSEYSEFAPLVLGQMFTALSASLKNMSKLRPKSLPRLADFAHRVIAAESELRWSDGAFERAYANNQHARHADRLEDSLLAETVVAFMRSRRNWTGTPTALLNHLDHLAGAHAQRDRTWPGTPSVLSRRLKDLRPNLTAAGIAVTSTRVGGRLAGRTMTLTLLEGQE